MFTSYTPFDKPSSGITAEEGLTFNVAGKGNVEFQTNVHRKKRTITLSDVLHTPGFRSNLISMSKLSIKGAEAHFKEDEAVIRTTNGIDIIVATCTGQLYMVNINKTLPTAFTAQSKQKSTSFATWHRCLAHVGAETICQIMTQNLVDGLNVSGEPSIGGLCKDCIYGKHTVHLYTENKMREKEVLEHVHIDIWSPSQVQFAGGASYFMIIMDSFSLYQTVAFLRSKLAETTLKIFKAFQAEAECQTGKKLK